MSRDIKAAFARLGRVWPPSCPDPGDESVEPRAHRKRHRQRRWRGIGPAGAHKQPARRELVEAWGALTLRSLERPELRDRAPADRHDDPLAGFGAPERRGKI